jgi:ribosomal protein S6E (S10)
MKLLFVRDLAVAQLTRGSDRRMAAKALNDESLQKSKRLLSTHPGYRPQHLPPRKTLTPPYNLAASLAP